MAEADRDTWQQLAYDEAVRAASEQLLLLESLRNRAGLLLSVATISSSFLGSQALNRGSSAIVWLALAGFVATSSFGLSVLRPAAWEFTTGTRDLFSEVVAVMEPKHPYLDRARQMRGIHAEIQRRAEGLGTLVEYASIALALDVILWLIAVAMS